MISRDKVVELSKAYIDLSRLVVQIKEISEDEPETTLTKEEITEAIIDLSYARAKMITSGYYGYAAGDEELESALYTLTTLIFVHYCVVYFIPDDDFFKNYYYEKYKVAANSSGMVSSASDNGSSASYFIYKSLSDLNFLGSDLMRTPFGKDALAYLESLAGINIVLL